MILTLSILIAVLLLLLKVKGIFSVFILVAFATGLYYAFLGPIYWLNVENGYFAGVNWSREIVFASQVFAFYLFTTCFVYAIFISKFEYTANKSTLNSKVIFTKPLIFCFVFGLLTCIYVFLDKNSRGSFFLVAYQFSDLLIAALLAMAVIKKDSKLFKIGTVFFIAYCLFVGFRYKLILFLFPILMLNIIESHWKARVIKIVAYPASVLALFTIVTITRVKFSGLNLDQLSTADSSQIMYGFLADSNIIFGVVSIVTYVVPTKSYVYAQPIIDSFLDLVPRFLYPEKNTGSQIYLVLEGLRTKEGEGSATTYPFFGEYLVMGGYFFAFIACSFLGWVIAKLTFLASRFDNHRAKWISVSLIAVLFGYYYVSRGYLPQFFKSIVFILIPYLVLIKPFWRHYRV